MKIKTNILISLLTILLIILCVIFITIEFKILNLSTPTPIVHENTDKVKVENTSKKEPIVNNPTENEQKIEKIKVPKYPFFITNTVHSQGTDGAWGDGYPPLFYFDNDGTYYWDAGGYFEGMIVATKGNWKIENGNLILNERYILILKNFTVETSEISNMDLGNNFDYEVLSTNNTYIWKMTNLGVSEMSIQLELPEDEIRYGYQIGYGNGDIWYSNTNLSFSKDLIWANVLKKQLKDKKY